MSTDAVVNETAVKRWRVRVAFGVLLVLLFLLLWLLWPRGAAAQEIRSCVNPATGSLVILLEDDDECGEDEITVSWGVSAGAADGMDGKSAYQLWLEQPGNEGKSVQAFFDSLTGAKGDDGANAYQVWSAQPGNEDGTILDFFIALTGAAGADGRDGAAGLDGVTSR